MVVKECVNGLCKRKEVTAMSAGTVETTICTEILSMLCCSIHENPFSKFPMRNKLLP